MPASLVLTAAPVATVQQLTSLLEAHGLSPQDPVAVATGSGALAAGALSAGAYELVLSVAAQPGHHTVQLLGLLAAAIRPGGKLVVQEVGGREGVGWLGRLAALAAPQLPRGVCCLQHSICAALCSVPSPGAAWHS